MWSESQRPAAMLGGSQSVRYSVPEAFEPDPDIGLAPLHCVNCKEVVKVVGTSLQMIVPP